MELNRDDIIKALECCSLGDCFPCPYSKWKAGCRDEMCGDALSLIKELTEENKRIQLKYKCTCDQVDSLKSILDYDTKTITEDTVRKMQERLKAESFIVAPETNLGAVVLASDIDRVAEKMLEGTYEQ